jgi:hypothetical protein
MGVVVPFPLARSCFTCSHAGFCTDGVTVCRLFGEVVDSETLWAADCTEYAFQPADQGMIQDHECSMTATVSDLGPISTLTCESCGRTGFDCSLVPVPHLDAPTVTDDFMLCGGCKHDLEMVGLWPWP